MAIRWQDNSHGQIEHSIASMVLPGQLMIGWHGVNHCFGQGSVAVDLGYRQTLLHFEAAG